MKNRQLLQKAGAWILSTALAVSCLSGIPTADAAAADNALTGWKSELYIDFGTGTNIVSGTDGQPDLDDDLATNFLLPSEIGKTASEAMIAGYGSWIYDSTNVGTVYGGAATTQKIGFDRPMPAGVTTEGGQYFRDWVFSPNGEPYTFSVDLPVGQYYVYAYTGNKTAGFNNTSFISFSDNNYKTNYDQSSNGGGQCQPPACIYVVNVTENTAGCGYGTLGMTVSDNTIKYKEEGGYDDSYTSANTVFYGTDANVKSFVSNGNMYAIDGTIVTARLNGIEIMPVENPVTAESVAASETDTNIALETEQTITLEAKAVPATTTERLEYFSSDDSIVKVNPKTGEITGIAQGEATVTATTPSLFNNAQKSAVYHVKVSEKTTLELDAASISLQLGGADGADTKTVKATFDAASLADAQKALVTPVTSSVASITFGSVTEATAPTESSKGIYTQDITFKATSAGSDNIKIARTTGRTADLRLSVTKPVTSIAFYDENQKVTDKYTMDVGNTLTVSAKGLPEDASNTAVSFKFKESTDIATITANGRITAKKAGTAIICATSRSNSNVVAEATLTITPGFDFSYRTAGINVNVGKTYKNPLTIIYHENVNQATLNTNMSYTSSAPTIASVGSDGTVKGLKPGTATITATAEDGGKTASYRVTVKQPATSLKVKKKSITLNINDKKKKTATIGASLLPSNSTDSITYKVKNSKIAKVDKKGKVTALKTGKTTITVKSTSGKTQTVTVSVTSPATKVKIKGKAKFTMKKGAKKTLKATVTPKKSTDSVKWSTSNKKIATVSKKGLVKAKKKGKVTITAKAGKKKATVKITIK
ncbi:MAG: hypothetical protein HFH37_04720 [Lachnospiraceae bacterium]|nr:hypothetical protein [Lachnospiraceae bacterium]